MVLFLSGAAKNNLLNGNNMLSKVAENMCLGLMSNNIFQAIGKFSDLPGAVRMKVVLLNV